MEADDGDPSLNGYGVPKVDLGLRGNRGGDDLGLLLLRGLGFAFFPVLFRAVEGLNVSNHARRGARRVSRRCGEAHWHLQPLLGQERHPEDGIPHLLLAHALDERFRCGRGRSRSALGQGSERVPLCLAAGRWDRFVRHCPGCTPGSLVALVIFFFAAVCVYELLGGGNCHACHAPAGGLGAARCRLFLGFFTFLIA